jgi:hypothetical protein
VKTASPGGATTPSGSAAEGGVETNGAVPAPLAVLAEARDPDAPVVVQVLDARRATADTVRIRLAFISKVVEPPPASQSRPDAQAQTQTVPLFRAGTNPADFCLLTADGNRRLFLLRDAQNNPVLDGSLQPLRPGERRVLDAMFPAPPVHPGQSSQSSQSGQSDQSDRVTLRLGKLTLRNIPITLTK